MGTVHRVADAVQEHGAWTVRHRIDRHWWQRPCRGVVVTHNGPLSHTELDLVALASGPRRTALAGAAALRFDGFDARDGRHLVVLPAGARPPSSPSATAHWSTMLDDRDVHPLRTPRRTRPARSVLDAASWHPSERYARWVVIAALQAGIVDVRGLREALTRRGRCRHRAVIVASVLDAVGGIQSLPERDFAAIWNASGLPLPSRQQAVRGPDRRYYLDVWSEALGFGAEIHGIPHLAVEQWDRDLVRANEVTIGGRRGLTFSSYAVRNHPHVVMDQLVRMGRAAGWRGEPSPGLLPVPASQRRRQGRRTTSR